jgi:uncharacterized protein DUF4154
MKRYVAIFIVLSSLLHALSMSQEQIVSNYIYNFALHTEWPKELKNENFEIYLVSSNKKLSATLKALLKEQRLHGKEIKISEGDGNKIPYSAQLVYVDTPYLNQYQEIYTALENRPVLMVSKGYDNKRLVMMNLTSTEKNVHFEINKANILNQRLTINPKLILLGGTELDIAKLYKGAQDSLLKTEKEFQAQLNKAQRLEKDISNKNAELNRAQQRVESDEFETCRSKTDTYYSAKRGRRKRKET